MPARVQFTHDELARSFVALTRLYESRIQTIPLALLQKFQKRAFGE